MRQHTKDRFVKFIFHELPEPSEFAGIGEIIESGEFPYTIRTESSKLSELVAQVTSKYDLADIDILSVPLEDVIAYIYRESSEGLDLVLP